MLMMQQSLWITTLNPTCTSSPSCAMVSEQRVSIEGGFASSVSSPANPCGPGPCERCAADLRGSQGMSSSVEASARIAMWGKFQSDPSHWWEDTLNKSNPDFLGLVDSTTGQLLWIYPPESDVERMRPTNLSVTMEQTLRSHGVDQPCRLGWQVDLEVGSESKLFEEGKLSEVVEALDLLVQRGSLVTHSGFYGVLKRCITEKNLVLGCRVHALVIKCGYESSTFLANHIIRMYASHRRLVEAKQVFTKVPAPNRHMWASIIMAHARHGHPVLAITFYRQMRQSTVKPDNHTFVAVLKACAGAGDLSTGKEVHADILRSGDHPDLIVGNGLVDMYAKCGSLEDARRVFDSLLTRDVVTWTAMIAGYAKHGLGQEALHLYANMQQEGITAVNPVTFVCLLQACARIGALHQGRQLHAQVHERGLEDDVVVGTCLVDMYAKCGSLQDARRVFDNLPARDVVMWNAMIAGYAQHGLGQEALSLHELMQKESTTPANATTFVCLLQACASIRALQQGKQLHAQVHARGLDGDLVVGNGLVNMYAKCGSLEEARRVFDNLPRRDVVTWNALIAGYAQCGLCQDALSLYGRMGQEGVTTADAVTFVCLLQACGSVAGLEKGKEIHAQIPKVGLRATDLFMANALIDMYGKSGSMVDAQQVFDALPRKDIVTWSAMMAGYARQGESDMVFHLFRRTRLEGIQPDGITFLSILTVCSHSGLVDTGQKYFEAMSREYGLNPTIQHYTCMVDLLGRAGLVEEAMETVKRMPFHPDSVVWISMLGACRKWSNVELGRHAFECVRRLDRNDVAAYVLMANIYAAAQMQEEAKEIQSMRLKIRAWKEPGQSWWTDSSGTVHTFVVGDRKHPDWHQIDSKLKDLVAEMKKQGYVPHLQSVLRDIPDDEKEAVLCGHSEKLAITYALLKTPRGTTIRVVKNLRVCEDCHTATALISKIEQRTIICRDANRFHVYKDGKCSCGNYW